MRPLARVQRSALLAAIVLAALFVVGAGCGSGSSDSPSSDDLVLAATKTFLQPLSGSEARATAKTVEKRASLVVGRAVTARWWNDSRRHLIISGLAADERQNQNLRRLLTAPGRFSLEADPRFLMPSYPSAFDAVEASGAISVPDYAGGPLFLPGRLEYLFGAPPDRGIVAGPVFLEDATESGELASHVAPPTGGAWPPESVVSRTLAPPLRLFHRSLPIGTEGAATTEWFLSPHVRAAVRLRGTAMEASPFSSTAVTVGVRLDNTRRRQLSDGLPFTAPDALAGSSSRIFLFRDDRIVSSAEVGPSARLPSDPRIHGGLRRNLVFEDVARADWDDIEALRESGPLPGDVSLALLP